MIFIKDLRDKAGQNMGVISEGLRPGHCIEFDEKKGELRSGYAVLRPKKDRPKKDDKNDRGNVGDQDPKPESGRKRIKDDSGKLHLVNGVVVGIDVREWTRRSLVGQLVVAGILHTCVRQTRDMLRDCQVFDIGDPLIVVPTGDGIYVAFTDGEERELAEAELHVEPQVFTKALCFVFTLNALVTEHNRLDTVKTTSHDKDDRPIVPMYLRFAMSMDHLLLCLDINDRLNAIGPGMVTCSRILSTDKGNHFLVHDKLLHLGERWGGLETVASANGLRSWDAHFHVTELPDSKIKSGHFRYADVFGRYTDAPLLAMRHMDTVKPAEYNIGSHDVLALLISR